MDPAEVLQRVGEKARVERLKRDRSLARPLVVDGAVGNALIDLFSTAAEFVDERWLSDHDASVAAGKVTLLGHEWTFDDAGSAWHYDPISGDEWPREFGLNIPFRNFASLGDPKFAAEVNRLQFLLPTLAGPQRQTDPQWYVRSWSTATAGYAGVGWTAGIEAAIRLVVFALLESSLPGGIERDLLADLVHRHVRYLSAVRSLGSSANNHRLAELAGQYVARRLFYSDGDDALAAELVEFEAVASSLIGSDGAALEQSPAYGIEICEWILLVATVANDPGTRSRLYKHASDAVSFLATLSDCEGNWPDFGDRDDGVVFLSGVDQPRRLAVLQRLAGAHNVASRQEFGLRTFGAGGYTVCRDDVAGREALWVFDHGPLGWGTLAAHGHADTLSLWFHFDGRPVIIDSGTYLYHGDPLARAAFRSTGMHNTIAVGDADSSVATGPFMWSTRERATGILEYTERGEDSWTVCARHEGYLKRFGVTHRRTVRRRGGVYQIIDELVPLPRRATCTGSLLFNPQLRVDLQDKAVRVQLADNRIMWVAFLEGTENVWTRVGGPQYDGYASPSFGQLVPAPRVRWSIAQEAPRSVIEVRISNAE